MGKIKLDETYIFTISIKMQFSLCSYWYQNSIFVEFWLLLSRVALTTVRYHELFDNTCEALDDLPLLVLLLAHKSCCIIKSLW